MLGLEALMWCLKVFSIAHCFFNLFGAFFPAPALVAVIFEFKKSVCLAHLIVDLYLMDAFAASLVQTMGNEDPAIESNRCASLFFSQHQPGSSHLIDVLPAFLV